MPYVSKSIDKKTVNGIVKDFMDKRMSYQHLSIKYELPIRDIKFHLSTKLEVPQCSLIATRSLKHRANSILSKPPSKVVRMTIDVLAHRLDLLDSSEPLENKTLQQIGDYHGTSKQRIEQIEQQVKKYLLIKELERTDDQ
jgi:DNA-directed RNA polymerase sigma subunit (sigma70/sigma32)